MSYEHPTEPIRHLDTTESASINDRIAVDPASAIPIRHMLQEYLVRAPEDDWTGKTSSAERRRLQNRLNSRAWRTSHVSDHLFLFRTDMEGWQVGVKLT
jgi:hypothetical protein